MNAFRESDGLSVIRFESWEEFCGHQKVPTSNSALFRGQRDPQWELISTWERDPGIAALFQDLRSDQTVRDRFSGDGYEAIRDVLVKDFRSRAVDIDPRLASLSDEELWAVGRHHELHTPILDWSRDYRVAAFFAFESYVDYLLKEDPDSDEVKRRAAQNPFVALWELRRGPDPLDPSLFEVIESTTELYADRRKAQQGVFTRIRTDRHRDIRSLFRDFGHIHRLTRHELPSDVAGRALGVLKEHDKTYATLMPDLAGAAKYANTYRLMYPRTFQEICAATGNDPGYQLP